MNYFTLFVSIKWATSWLIFHVLWEWRCSLWISLPLTVYSTATFKWKLKTYLLFLNLSYFYMIITIILCPPGSSEHESCLEEFFFLPLFLVVHHLSVNNSVWKSAFIHVQLHFVASIQQSSNIRLDISKMKQNPAPCWSWSIAGTSLRKDLFSVG